jgi:hypothetical protein
MRAFLAAASLPIALALCHCSGSEKTCQDLRNCEAPPKEAGPDSAISGGDASVDVDDELLADVGHEDRSLTNSSDGDVNEGVDGVLGESNSTGDGADSAADRSESIDNGVVSAFGDKCTSDDLCKIIGPSFFCLKSFDVFTVAGGLCTRPCEERSQTDCTEMMGTCLSERSGSNDASPTPRSACFPTCKLDVPCRTGLKCQFTFRNGMLVEPSACVPMDEVAGDAG